jgi:hypothetical protein
MGTRYWAMNNYRCQANLRLATRIEHVVATANLFVVTLTERETAALPAGCRPRSIASRKDLAHWASRVRGFTPPAHRCRSAEFSALQEFFRRAEARARELGRDAPPGGAPAA